MSALGERVSARLRDAKAGVKEKLGRDAKDDRLLAEEHRKRAEEKKAKHEVKETEEIAADAKKKNPGRKHRMDMAIHEAIQPEAKERLNEVGSPRRENVGLQENFADKEERMAEETTTEIKVPQKKASKHHHHHRHNDKDKGTEHRHRHHHKHHHGKDKEHGKVKKTKESKDINKVKADHETKRQFSLAMKDIASFKRETLREAPEPVIHNWGIEEAEFMSEEEDTRVPDEEVKKQFDKVLRKVSSKKARSKLREIDEPNVTNWGLEKGEHVSDEEDYKPDEKVKKRFSKILKKATSTDARENLKPMPSPKVHNWAIEMGEFWSDSAMHDAKFKGHFSTSVLEEIRGFECENLREVPSPRVENWAIKRMRLFSKTGGDDKPNEEIRRQFNFVLEDVTGPRHLKQMPSPKVTNWALKRTEDELNPIVVHPKDPARPQPPPVEPDPRHLAYASQVDDRFVVNEVKATETPMPWTERAKAAFQDVVANVKETLHFDAYENREKAAEHRNAAEIQAVRLKGVVNGKEAAMVAKNMNLDTQPITTKPKQMIH